MTETGVRPTFRVAVDAVTVKVRKTTPSRHSKVEIVQVNRKVWSKALELADGDIQRIEVHGPNSVTVRNKKVRRQAIL